MLFREVSTIPGAYALEPPVHMSVKSPQVSKLSIVLMYLI